MRHTFDSMMGVAGGNSISAVVGPLLPLKYELPDPTIHGSFGAGR